MYKHAYGHKRSSDEWDNQDHVEFLRKNLEAVGLTLPTPEFACDVMRRLDLYHAQGIHGSVELADQLNTDGILNAKGGRWTHALVKIFIDHYRLYILAVDPS